MPPSPTLQSGQLVSLKITSEGAALPDAAQIVSVKVRSALNRIASAEIVLLDGDMPEETFPLSDADTFKPGKEIEIKAGYEQSVETIFKGVVVRHGIKITGNNNARLIVECRDKAVRMTVGRKNANYVDSKDSDIIRTLAGQSSGVSVDVDSTNTTHKELVQHYCTDWDFLVSRAEVNGLVVISDQNKVTVKKPQVTGSAALTLTYGTDLLEFHADIDSRTQLTSVATVTWDPSQQAIVEKQAAPLTLNQQGDLSAGALAEVASPDSFRLQTPAPLEQTELTDWAKSQQLKAGLSRIRGRMKFQGSALAKVGGLIELAGVGARFNGMVYVCGVTHEITGGNWLTDAEFGLPSEWFADRRDLVSPPASGLLPGVEGLQIGVVMKRDGDPAGENRVQVSIPLLQVKQDGVWARLSNSYASEGCGDFFIPETGDEVLLGYLNNDPSHPVILGSLYSSKRATPYPLTAENYTKAIVTKSKLRVIFDDEKKQTTIVTPANNRIVLSDDGKSIQIEDQTGNKALFETGGITLDSPKDIVIKAQGKIQVSATGEISLASQADVKVSGLNVSNTAQVAFSAKGSASAELSATGETTVKGAMVMIN